MCLRHSASHASLRHGGVTTVTAAGSSSQRPRALRRAAARRCPSHSVTCCHPASSDEPADGSQPPPGSQARPKKSTRVGCRAGRRRSSDGTAGSESGHRRQRCHRPSATVSHRGSPAAGLCADGLVFRRPPDGCSPVSMGVVALGDGRPARLTGVGRSFSAHQAAVRCHRAGHDRRTADGDAPTRSRPPAEGARWRPLNGCRGFAVAELCDSYIEKSALVRRIIFNGVIVSSFFFCEDEEIYK